MSGEFGSFEHLLFLFLGCFVCLFDCFLMVLLGERSLCVYKLIV